MTDFYHNTDSENIPEMEYQDAYWQDALSKLEAAERAIKQKRRKKVGFGLILLFIVGFSVGKFSSLQEKKDIASLGQQKIDSVPQVENNNQVSEPENKSGTPEIARRETPAQSNNEPGQIQNIIPDKNIIISPDPRKELLDNIGNNELQRREKSELIKDKVTGFDLSEEKLQPTNNDAVVTGATKRNDQETDPLVPAQIHSNDQKDISNNKLSDVDVEKEIVEVEALVPLYYTLPENANPSPLKLVIPMKPAEPDPTWRISAQLGSNLLSGYSTTRNELAFEPFGGLVLSGRINPKFSIASGVQYFQINEPLQTLTKDYVSFAFKREISTVVVYTDKIHYLAVPLNFFYNLNKKHSFSASFQTAYQLTGNNRLVTYQPNGSFTEVEEMGYTNGFRDFNYSIGLGYEYRIRRGKSIGISANFGLTDITKNYYFKVDRFDRNSFIAAYLKFDLFTK